MTQKKIRCFPQCEECESKATASREEAVAVKGQMVKRTVHLCTGCVKKWDRAQLPNTELRVMEGEEYEERRAAGSVRRRSARMSNLQGTSPE